MQSDTFPSYLELDEVAGLQCEDAAAGSAVKGNATSTQVGQVEANEPAAERANAKVNEAAIAFARATGFYREGQLDRAIELFDEVISLARDDVPQRDVACVAAHINLYKIHRSLGHEREATEHFNKAVSLGANARRLEEF